MTPTSDELSLVDRWQRNFPLVDRPFAVVGRSAALDERSTISTFGRMQAAGIISRIGAVVRPNTVGVSTLAALRVPPERLEEVASIVSSSPLVTHNYERIHPLNLWFVIAGPDAAAVDATIQTIETQTSLDVINLPLQKAYHLDLGFPLSGATSNRRNAIGEISYHSNPNDRRILAAMEDGLPLVERPYGVVAGQLGLKPQQVIERLDCLTASGVVTRLGCVLHHRKLGFHANAMAVWDIPDHKVDAVAEIFVRNPRVTLCYRRPRRPPAWPYNLFCMVHARDRREANAVIAELNHQAVVESCRQAVLFSLRKFKQRGAIFSDAGQRAVQ